MKILIDEHINNLSNFIVSLLLNRENINTKNITTNNLLTSIEEQSSRIRGIISDILSNTYYGDEDKYNTIQKIVNVLSVRQTIYRVLPTFIYDSIYYNSTHERLSDIVAHIAKGFGFNIVDLMNYTPSLKYFIDNMSTYFTDTKATEKGFDRLLKLYTSLEITPITLSVLEYSNNTRYTTLNYKGKILDSILGEDLVTDVSTFFDEYRELEDLSTYDNRNVPLLSLLISVNQRYYRNFFSLIYDIMENKEKYSDMFVSFYDISMSVYEATTSLILLYLCIMDHWLDTVMSTINHLHTRYAGRLLTQEELIEYFHEFLLGILPDRYINYTQLIRLLSKNIVYNLDTLAIGDKESLFSSCLEIIIKENVSRPSSFRVDFGSILEKVYLTVRQVYLYGLTKNVVVADRDLLLLLTRRGLNETVSLTTEFIVEKFRNGIFSISDLISLAEDLCYLIDQEVDGDYLLPYMSTVRFSIDSDSQDVVKRILIYNKPTYLHLSSKVVFSATEIDKENLHVSEYDEVVKTQYDNVPIDPLDTTERTDNLIIQEYENDTRASYDNIPLVSGYSFETTRNLHILEFEDLLRNVYSVHPLSGYVDFNKTTNVSISDYYAIYEGAFS